MKTENSHLEALSIMGHLFSWGLQQGKYVEGHAQISAQSFPDVFLHLWTITKPSLI